MANFNVPSLYISSSSAVRFLLLGDSTFDSRLRFRVSKNDQKIV
jgi:hypothetical protein